MAILPHFDIDHVRRIATRRAGIDRYPVEIYEGIDPDTGGSIWYLEGRWDDEPHLYDDTAVHLETVDVPETSRYRVTAKSRAAAQQVADDERSFARAQERQREKALRRVETKRIAPRERQELPSRMASGRRELTKQQQAEHTAAIAQITRDPEVLKVLEPYRRRAVRDPETGMYVEPYGPRRGRERQIGPTHALNNFVAGMILVDAEINYEELRDAFLSHLAKQQTASKERRTPEVAAQTIAAFAHPYERKRGPVMARRGGKRDRWTGQKPESFQGTPETLRMARLIVAMAERENRARADAREHKKRGVIERRKARKQEFIITRHPSGTVTAGPRKKRKK